MSSASNVQYIRAQLVNYTNADCSDKTVKNSRYHYHLRFDEAIGWDWVYGQVTKVSAETDTDLEVWKVRPSGMQSFEIEVREVARRPNIDENQSGLSDFER